ncbi:MAG: tRNA 2-thiouridine(34) synthase MnmA [Proteobacteria bacterium]|nr:tRNA 2-thiouridine(34) synthase MnmA [Pseudomonadota bacterium]
MTDRKKVVVAMSGGVDSSVALGVLKEQGYDCIGVSMQLWDYAAKELAEEQTLPGGSTAGSCCSLEDLAVARRVAETFGVPFYVLNMETAFEREVVGYFVDSYLEGSTPNPCIKCNEVLKFDLLLKKALALGVDSLATGHYARIDFRDGRYRLLKGVDPEKDQSYFLFTMTEHQLAHIRFPLGAMTKTETREAARRFGLTNSEKQESQEICFIEESGYGEFIRERTGREIPAGEIVDAEGTVIGAHTGFYNFTIGQRKGLGLSGGPYYVTHVDAKSNRVTVSSEEGLYSPALIATEINWIDPVSHEAAKSDDGLTGITAKIRYRHAGVDAAAKITEDGKLRVDFTEPQRAVAAGQAVVLYREDVVLGGGWIERATE